MQVIEYQPFVPPVHAGGDLRVFVVGERQGSQWRVTAHVGRHDQLGEAIGELWTPPATQPQAPDDVVEAARRWVVASLEPGVVVKRFDNLNCEYGPGDRDFKALARILLAG